MGEGMDMPHTALVEHRCMLSFLHFIKINHLPKQSNLLMLHSPLPQQRCLQVVGLARWLAPPIYHLLCQFAVYRTITAAEDEENRVYVQARRETCQVLGARMFHLDHFTQNLVQFYDCNYTLLFACDRACLLLLSCHLVHLISWRC